MTGTQLLLLFVLGAAALAPWVDLRLESRRPSELRSTLLHVLLSSLASQAVIPLVTLAAEAGSEALELAALLGLVLPGLVYAFLSGIWLVRVVRERLPA